MANIPRKYNSNDILKNIAKAGLFFSETIRNNPIPTSGETPDYETGRLFGGLWWGYSQIRENLNQKAQENYEDMVRSLYVNYEGTLEAADSFFKNMWTNPQHFIRGDVG